MSWLARTSLASFALLVSVGSAASAPDNVELAALFSNDLQQLESALSQSRGDKKVLVGLVLADAYGITSSERALQQLDDLRAQRVIGGEAGPDVSAYLSAITCSALVREGQIENADVHCKDAQAALDDIDNDFVRTRILASANFLAVRNGRLEEGLEFGLRAERIARRIDNSFLLATALNASALTLSFSGLHAQAIDRYKRARELLNGAPDQPLAKMITFNLGLAYRELGDSRRALDAFKEGFEWAEATNQPHRSFIGRIEMANALTRLDRPRESVDLLSEALNEPNALLDPDSLMHALLSIGNAELSLGNQASALEYLDRGLALAVSRGNPRRERQLRLARIEALHARDLPDEARNEARALVAELKSTQPNDELDQALTLLAELELKAGDLAASNAYAVEARQLADEARGKAFERKITMMEVASRIERAEQEKARAESGVNEVRARAERNLLLAIVAGMLFVFTLIIGIYDHFRRRQNQRVAEHQRNSEVLESLVHKRTAALEEQMSARMKTEAEQRKLEQDLAESEKLRALGQLTGGVAHDFNNLLTIISGAAELLERDPNMPIAERLELVNTIQEAARTGADVNTGLLAYARRQQLHPEPFDLAEFLEVSRSLLQQTLGEEMTLQIASVPVSILVDRGQLSTAIINILTNAREASGARGAVRITVDRKQSEIGEAAWIRIRDWGCGMTKSNAERSIEPFYSTKESTVATGLGLSLVYGFVQQSGGQMQIESEPGQGTTVTLIFPVASSNGDQDDDQDWSRMESKRVLLVDDNNEVRGIVEKMLTSLGHDVVSVSNGADALDLLADSAPDFMVTDVLMPGEIGGRELAQLASEKLPKLPILMISGFAEALELEFPLLQKPFSLSEMRAALDALLGNQETTMGSQ